MPNDEKKQEQTLGQFIETLMANDPQKALKYSQMLAQQTTLDKQITYLRDMLKVVRESVRLPNQRSKIDDIVKELKVMEEAVKNKNLDKMPVQKSALKKLCKEGYNLINNLHVDIKDSAIPAWKQAVKKVCTSKIANTQKESSIYDKPLPDVNNPSKNKMGLKDQLSNDMNNYLFVKGKSGGANSPGKFGGEYVGCYVENGELKIQRLLFKQDTSAHKFKADTIHHNKNMIEVISADIMQALIGDSAASVFFARGPESKEINNPDPTGSNVYVASVFYDNANELYKELYELDGKQPPDDRPKLLGVPLKEFTDVFKRKIVDEKDPNQCAFKGLPQVAGVSLLVGDFDIHSANFMVVKNDKGEKSLVKIDHGAALDHLEDNVHPHSHSRHPVGLGPTNHFRELPRSLRVSHEMADELIRISHFDKKKMNQVIDNAIDNAAKNYGPEPINMLAKTLGIKVDPKMDKADVVAACKLFLKDKIAARQVSLSNYALEIKMSLNCKLNADKTVKPNAELDALILANPSYFQRGVFHFRSAEQHSHLGVRFQNSDYDAALKQYARNLIQKSSILFKSCTDTAHSKKDRADGMIELLKTLASVESDGAKKVALLEKASDLQKMLTNYQNNKNDDTKSQLINVLDDAHGLATQVVVNQRDQLPNTMMAIASVDWANVSEREAFLAKPLLQDSFTVSQNSPTPSITEVEDRKDSTLRASFSDTQELSKSSSSPKSSVVQIMSSISDKPISDLKAGQEASIALQKQLAKEAQEMVLNKAKKSIESPKLDVKAANDEVINDSSHSFRKR